MEIISGVERRRRWRIEDKLRTLAEIDGGATLAGVARRHDVSRGLLWQRRGRLAEPCAPEPVFLPLQVSDTWLLEPVAPARVMDPRIEIALPDGTCVRVGADVDAVALRRVLSVLRR